MDEAPVSLKWKVLIALALCLVLAETVAYAVARDTLPPDGQLRFVLVVTSAFAITGALIVLIIGRSLEPLRRITDAARRLGAGEEELGLDIQTHDEMQVLAEALGESARALGASRRQQEEQVRMIVQTEKLATMGALTAGVAHEVNNPLAYIIANEEMACQDLERCVAEAALPPEARKLLDESVESLRLNLQGLLHIKRIVMSLRELSKASNAEKAEVDLSKVADSVIVLAGDRARKLGVTLEADVPKALTARAAAQEVGQVLLNLVINGIDAAGRDGRVWLRGAAEGAHVVFRVQDSGPGVPPAAQAKLFQPFFTTKKDGVGLGLSISHKIVKDHGGTLEFACGPNRLTEFTVRLPRSPLHPTKESPPWRPTASRRL
jgi:two-component system NtrC family sensor kinase